MSDRTFLALGMLITAMFAMAGAVIVFRAADETQVENAAHHACEPFAVVHRFRNSADQDLVVCRTFDGGVDIKEFKR
jgi:hypothetical protein